MACNKSGDKKLVESPQLFFEVEGEPFYLINAYKSIGFPESGSSLTLAGHRYLNQKNKATIPIIPATNAQMFKDIAPIIASQPNRIAIPMNIKAPIESIENDADKPFCCKFCGSENFIKYGKKNDIELPYEIKPLLGQAYRYMHELKNPTNLNNECSICKKLNPENADYCCYCGSSLNITKISPDLLQSKNNDSNHPKSDRTEPYLCYYNPIKNDFYHPL